ncbi:MAG: phosphoenolpyruvate synthase [Deltaproteobacteria bacterium]|nr:phosphoenolpyruvate synthase [Deltaproteobacteria bacterium]MBW1952578.1 phosphoenolpyruvate synthase [Deltaproteobacteria bacterium]MBW1986145.1 phosphoenolpyruvate synthase [Deltaproteobacteria bacterium]MBW2134169.1 phosphoenolpyruvate synthase [Deltaproteobacteria bacterium]
MFKFLRRFLKSEEDQQLRLKEKFSHFRRLLEGNNQALEIMADMEEKLAEEYLFDTGYIRSQVDRLAHQVTQIITELNKLTQDRYPELVVVHRQLQEAIQQELTSTPEVPKTPYILPLTDLTREMAASVGSKMANLGEIRSRLEMRVPDGFAISAWAYKRFLETSGLAEELKQYLTQSSLDDLESLEAVSEQMQTRVRQAQLPPDLAEALIQAGQSLAGRGVAVRSSAVGEDTHYSFAGQFRTLLNVPPEQLVEHYKEIVASKFTSRAIFYWKYQQFSVNELPMAVGCLAMVPAKTSGVMFSVDPHAPDSNTLVITAVWGLGKYAVDGRISPDIYRVSRTGDHQVQEQRLAQKPVALTCAPEGETKEISLPPEQGQSPCLTPEQIKSLAEIALKLEKHFGGPQDIEWAIDERDEIFVLQTRPLRISAAAFGAAATPPPEPTAPPLLKHGIRAVGGAAAGPVYLFLDEKDTANIPPGSVVVARQPSARLVLVMDRIAAIITEVGSPTGHMSILAREFRIPTLVEVGGATRILRTGQMVTVDADTARIYQGIIPELLVSPPAAEEAWRQNPVFEKLRWILKKITPLFLLDPDSPDFQPGNCRTWHDITRFCHEKAMDAMFDQDVEESLRASGVMRLKSEIPLNLFILDLGGGLRTAGLETVEEQDIACRPFQALLRGFHHPRVSWAGQVVVDFKGFMSVFANTLYDMAKSERGLGGKSFAIITENYLNFNSRLGYHFSIVDAYLSEEQNDNYISFQFKGGAAEPERRERRARLLGKILQELGYKVQVKGDLVQGRLVKYSLLETEQTLELTGLLMAFARQLDLALASDAVMNRFLTAFREGDYSLRFLRPEQAPS